MYSHICAHINSRCNLTSAVPSNSKVQADISSGSNPLNCKCKMVHTHVFSTDMKAAPPNLSKYTTLIFHTPHKCEQLYTHHEALWRQEQTWFVSFGKRESKSHVSSWESKPERDLLITSHKFLRLSLWTHSKEQSKFSYLGYIKFL